MLPNTPVGTSKLRLTPGLPNQTRRRCRLPRSTLERSASCTPIVMITFVLLGPAYTTSAPWPLWPKDAVPDERPGFFGPEAPSFPYPDDEHLTNVTWPTLTPYLVENQPLLVEGQQPALRSAVVVAPGGGYRILAWNKEGTDIALWLNGLGISAFVLKYRVPSRPWLPFGGAPLQDAQRAMGLVREAAVSQPALGLNASSIGFIGFSAGGHLSAHIATTCSASPAARAYPPVDAADARSCRPDFSLLVYPWQLSEDALHLNVTAAHPPAFVAQAWDDPAAPILDCSLPYYTRLKQAGAPASELHIYPAGGHGYGRCTVGASKQMTEEVCTWDKRAAQWLHATV
eukprot:Transcript_18810.p1 GENE.Transcript_18810~~Transcript_18810.p1  ORF type:complete len:343 (-),score=59.27 Transcript_18810:526-1554(-)